MPTRRSFLKGTGAVVGAAATADLARSVASDDQYEVALFVSEGTAAGGAQHGDELLAAKRAKTWIEGAFNHPTNPYTVSVTVSETVVEPPTERAHESGALEWWKRAYDGSDTDVWAADSNILLTAGAAGGEAYPGGQHAVAGSGRHLTHLPAGYEPFGAGRGYRGMATVLHELGHNLLPVNTYYAVTATLNQDDTHVTHHDLGATVEHPAEPGWYGMTPMLYRNEQNNCGCNENPEVNPDGYALFYADCMLKHLP